MQENGAQPPTAALTALARAPWCRTRRCRPWVHLGGQPSQWPRLRQPCTRQRAIAADAPLQCPSIERQGGASRRI
eukprot:11179598-Lingulodinium_polyedra.AAC.1